MSTSPEKFQVISKMLDEMAIPEHLREALFQCDLCSGYGLPEDFAYIGPKDRDNTTCDPFAEWENICHWCSHAED